MKKLAPLKFEKVWGYELWLASTHPNGTQNDFLDFCVKPFPLIVKIIQADEALSVQVHPDDKTSVEIEGSGAVGKSECWYVLDADANAKITCGINSTPDELKSAASEIEKHLNIVPVKKGDFVFIPAGTVHSIGKGMRLLEVQQSSDITYRLHDWGRGREVHIENAVKSIKILNEENRAKPKPFGGFFGCEYFSLEEIKVGGAISISTENENDDCEPTLFFVIEGSGTVSAGNAKENFSSEDIFAMKSEKIGSSENDQSDEQYNKNKIVFTSNAARIMKISCKKI